MISLINYLFEISPGMIGQVSKNYKDKSLADYENLRFASYHGISGKFADDAARGGVVNDMKSQRAKDLSKIAEKPIGQRRNALNDYKKDNPFLNKRVKS